MEGFVAGWGREEITNSMLSIPKVVGIKIVSEANCRSFSVLIKNLITSRTLCAGNRDNTGPCVGDSGSGLMIWDNQNQRWLLRAIVSVGETFKANQRCNLQEYVVYCDVAKHLEWVQSNML